MGQRDGCMFEACGLHRKFQPAGIHSEAVASVLVDLASLYSGGRSRKLEFHKSAQVPDQLWLCSDAHAKRRKGKQEDQELKPAHFLTTVSHCTHMFCVSTAAPALILT